MSIILIIISVLHFLMGYAFLNNKAEDFLLWSFTGKLEKVNDKEEYKKLQGMLSITLGIIFFLVPVTIYFFNRFDINREWLYLWLLVLACAVVVYVFKVRRFFK